jgi:hypothetical protein
VHVEESENVGPERANWRGEWISVTAGGVPPGERYTPIGTIRVAAQLACVISEVKPRLRRGRCDRAGCLAGHVGLELANVILKKALFPWVWFAVSPNPVPTSQVSRSWLPS